AGDPALARRARPRRLRALDRARHARRGRGARGGPAPPGGGGLPARGDAGAERALRTLRGGPGRPRARRRDTAMTDFSQTANDPADPAFLDELLREVVPEVKLALGELIDRENARPLPARYARLMPDTLLVVTFRDDAARALEPLARN